jgi:hypothetical protein
MEQPKFLVGTLMLKSKGWKVGEVNVETRFALKGTRHRPPHAPNKGPE